MCEQDPYRRDVLRARFPGCRSPTTCGSCSCAKLPWNKGRSYTIAKRETYANKGSWSAAMHRMLAPACTSCGWDKARCDVHHIEPRRDGGEMTLDNGILICPNCHRLAENGSLSASELRMRRDFATPIGERVGAVMPSEAAQIDLLCGGFPERARTSPSPGSAPDSPEPEPASSSSSPESPRLFDPDGFSSRTYPGLYLSQRRSGLRSHPWNAGRHRVRRGLPGSRLHVSSECRSDDAGCSSSEPSLTEILEPPQNVPARYSLSARAARGILRRAEKRGRTLPSHLSAALAAVARTTTTGKADGS